MKRIFTILSAVLLTASLWAQAPQSFSYQAIIRGEKNTLIVNKPVGMKISLLQGSENGSTVYVETHMPTSNDNGLVSIAIGNGNKVSGDFTTIDWSKGPYFVKTETDPNGVTNYSLSSVSQLLSVPYALYAGNALPNGGENGQGITMCDGVPTWTYNDVCPGKIKTLNCKDVIVNGTLNSGVSALNVSFVIKYTEGNGGPYDSQKIGSTDVSGLTATLQSGSFNKGNGSLLYNVTGISASFGLANFILNISGQTCSVSIPVNPSAFVEVKTLTNDKIQSPFLCGGLVNANIDKIVERGILYGKSQNLDYNTATAVGSFQYGLSQGGSVSSFQTAKITSMSGVGEFNVNIMYLFENTKYYYCAYAKTESGKIVKGEELEIPTRNFKRDTRSPDVANVFWKTTFNLFDLQTDEVIEPDANGLYKFYYSSNENPNVFYKELTASQLPNFLFYKFKTQENCKKWTEIKKGILKP
jgi:hypothetical protein